MNPLTKTIPDGYSEPVTWPEYFRYELQDRGWKSVLLYVLAPRLHRYHDNLGWELLGPGWLTRKCLAQGAVRLFVIGHQPGYGLEFNAPRHD